MLIQIWIPSGGSPTFVWEPQEAFSPASNIFDQSCILSSSRPESKFGSTTSIGTTVIRSDLSFFWFKKSPRKKSR
jgi:hypothetical protein